MLLLLTSALAASPRMVSEPDAAVYSRPSTTAPASPAPLCAPMSATRRKGDWLRVDWEGGSGWIPANATVDATDPVIARLSLARDLTHRGGVPGHALLDVATCLRAVADRTAEAAWLETLALSLALDQAQTWPGAPDLERAIVARYPARLVYSEPAGVHLLAPGPVWDLSQQVRGERACHPDTSVPPTPRDRTCSIAHELAWLAATREPAGECEGDLACTIARWEDHGGRYLATWAGWPHTAEAWDALLHALLWATDDDAGALLPTAPEDRQRLRDLLAPLQARASADNQPEVLAAIEKTLTALAAPTP